MEKMRRSDRMIKQSRNYRSIYLGALVLFACLGQRFSYAQAPMRVIVEPNNVSVCKDEQLLLRYCYRGVPFKPYVQRLFSPAGINILRDAPIDHKHHHALMFAVAVDGVNFWEEQRAPGRQEHQAFTDVTVDRHGDIPWARVTERLAWLNPNGTELLLNERRTIRLCRLNDPKLTLMTWESRFEVPQGKKSVTLTGSHYFGLGMRFLESMDKIGRFLNAHDQPGQVVRGDERLVQSAWCAYSAEADGKPVTVAMFDHPDNPRPVTWFTMTNPFAYLSATLNLHKQPLTVLSDKSLRLRYGVALWDGRMSSELIDRFCHRWAEWPR
jgi:hypothetical protein